ncbi:MAG: pantothenate kinase [Oscillospiraceae bacterium]|jgi:type II pantothenate kinase|nr:pantothenate kinase [Oscillospiraceae bacterium]
MKIKLGVDVGGSTTKIVGVTESGEPIGMLQVRAADQVTSLYGALGRFLQEQSLTLQQIERIYLTGVGAGFFSDFIYGIPVTKVDEFTAIGRGALKLTGMNRAYVVSIGTGSAFVRASESGVTRVGGSGVGGGTLVGLSYLLLREENISRVSELAYLGDAGNIDLLVGAISPQDIPELPAHATAANFGNVNPTSGREEMAFALINMVMQTVGMLAVFATLNDPDAIRDVILIGSAALVPQCRDVMDAITQLTGIRFTIPPDAPYATAIGTINS